ncbi:flagellar hook protein FlgE [Citrobacter farmeri]|uniref:flagellar hook protein FlgE n=1 Tax=Citrobacter farmeri TaxID=67824 RepID=UPI00189F892F|nr:flagellar hook protein FlgE [Citrobacter farmeri]EHK0945832.1 flagellar basal body protein FlgE [Citrobacter farmeri]EKU0082245.1 flagellar basal body protein FlgE [Citrobacter farmeri]EKX4541422.1 flagellar basal body protein FlgE [Citrobacter farmeri]MBJ9165133.1 flagellar basal body protein FlgE [Citrobacter farmeri]MDB2166212.1 flagellar hook protein FlgE [Citrobacter farmeri]
MSYEIAATGLNAVNQQLDGISNNIANAGTVGYKSQTTQFSAMYADSQAMGVGVAGTAQSISRSGSMVSTSNALDLAINADGFFVMSDDAGNLSYTRAGSFETDKDGNIVNAAGDHLQGYPVDSNGTLQTGAVTDLQIQTGNIPASATTQETFTANLDSSSEVIDSATVPFDPNNSDSYNSSYTTTVYDSLGNEHAVSQYFIKTSDNQWEVHYTFDGEEQSTTVPLSFNSNGELVSPTTPPTVTFPTDGADPITMTFDYSSCTQFGSDFSVTTNSADGYASATQNGVQVDDDGKVYATYSNGERMLQGQVVLATFPDENGLEAVSGTAWVQTGESGAPLLGTPGSGATGSLSSGMLESSNVDITSELVELMTAQRNYQANTKVISSSTQLDDALFQAM